MPRTWRNVYGQICEEETAVEALQRFWNALSPEFRWDNDFERLGSLARKSDARKELGTATAQAKHADLIPACPSWRLRLTGRTHVKYS